MQIEIIIREKIARTVDKHAFAVCGNSDYTVKFDFDSEWDSYETKTARFKWGGSYTDVPFSGHTCPMPVIVNAYRVEIGVYAGELHTSSPALLPLRRSILDGNETESEPSQEIKDAFGRMLAGKIDVPQVAKVGEVLTVEEVDADGKPTKWKTADAVSSFIVNFTKRDDKYYQCDKTIAEIKEAAAAKKDVSAYFDEVKYPLIATALESASFLYVSGDAWDRFDLVIEDGEEVGINSTGLYSDIVPVNDGNYGDTLVLASDEYGDGWHFIALPKGRSFTYSAGTGGYSDVCTVDPQSDANRNFTYGELVDKEEFLAALWGCVEQARIICDGAVYDCDTLSISTTDTEQVISKAVFRSKDGKTITVTPDDVVLDDTTTPPNVYYIEIAKNNGEYSTDISFSEALKMFNDGVVLIAKFQNRFVPLFDVDSTQFCFRGITVFGGDYIDIYWSSFDNTINIKKAYYLPYVTLSTLGDYLNQADAPIIMSLSDDSAPDGGGLLFYNSGKDNLTIYYNLITNKGDYYTVEYNRRYGNKSLTKVISFLPTPTTAQVGQIVRIKSVSEAGRITETETVDIPSQKALKWVTVHSSDLTETKRELIISTDTDGKSIADYNPVGLSLIVSTPADATVESNNGAPWIYPSATKFDNAIRVIGNISGWKTIARDSAFVFNGGSSAMSCTGNVNTSLPTYKLDGYALDGVRIFFNGTNDHLPVGTHVEVAILCEVEQ